MTTSTTLPDKPEPRIHDRKYIDALWGCYVKLREAGDKASYAVAVEGTDVHPDRLQRFAFRYGLPLQPHLEPKVSKARPPGYSNTGRSRDKYRGINIDDAVPSTIRF